MPPTLKLRTLIMPATIVAKISGPKLLRVGHKGVKILLEAPVIEGLEGPGTALEHTESSMDAVVVARASSVLHH
jgi:hypothetical protein